MIVWILTFEQKILGWIISILDIPHYEPYEELW